MPRAYTLALTAAAALVAAGAAFTWHTFRTFETEGRAALRRQRDAGTLPPGVDAETADVWGMSVKVPRGLHSRLDAALFLSDRWYVFVPLTVAAGLGVAWLVRRRRARP